MARPRGVSWNHLAEFLRTLEAMKVVLQAAQASRLENCPTRHSRILRTCSTVLQSDETISPEQIEMAIDVLEGRDPERAQSNEPEPYLTLREVGRKLGVAPCSLWRWGVPGHALGGRRRFKLTEVEAYLHSDEMKERADELRKERRQA